MSEPNLQSVPLRGGPVRFEGAVSLEVSEGGVQPWRVPGEERDLFEAPLLERAAVPAGVRVTLRTDSSRLVVAVDPCLHLAAVDEVWTFDLLVDGQLHQREHLPREATTLRFEGLPEGTHRLELYLSQAVPVKVEGVRVDEGAHVEVVEDDRPRWVVYGSSITMCRTAAGPSETWPAIVANRFGLNLTCLGFGGQCHMDQMIARTIARLPADYISLCLGINTHGGTFSERTFRPAVIGLIKTIRDGHPETPIVCVSPIYSPPREDGPGATGMTLKMMREWVADAIAKLSAHGDHHLHHVDGLELFGPDYLHLMPDELHPDAEGYRALADRYSELVMPRFGLEPQPV